MFKSACRFFVSKFENFLRLVNFIPNLFSKLFIQFIKYSVILFKKSDYISSNFANSNCLKLFIKLFIHIKINHLNF